MFLPRGRDKADFDKVNGYHFEQTDKANRYANMLMPIIANIGNVMYVIVALLGAVLAADNLQNISIVGLGMFTPALIVSFLQTTRQFSNNIGQVSNQVNSVVMGLAGAQRIIALIDEKPEVDDGLCHPRQCARGQRSAHRVRGTHGYVGMETSPQGRRLRHLYQARGRRAAL